MLVLSWFMLLTISQNPLSIKPLQNKLCSGLLLSIHLGSNSYMYFIYFSTKSFVYFVRLRSGINMQTAHQSLGDLTLRLPD